MKFTLAEDNIENMCYHRKIDESGRYEIWIKPVIFGWRVGFGKVNEGSYLFDYCAGNNKSDVENLYGKIEKILSLDLELDQILYILPKQNVKPYFNDSTCLFALDTLAKGYVKEDLPDLDELKLNIYVNSLGN